MSVYSTNEFIIASNNSMNENSYNKQKLNKSHKIKMILKPLLKMLKKNRKATKDTYTDYCEERCVECCDNYANEELESNILNEIEDCGPNAAIFVVDQEGNWNLTPVTKGQTTVPVHFARTDAGTFFWTSMKTADSDVTSAYHCYTECQQASQQQPLFQDRWVQA